MKRLIFIIISLLIILPSSYTAATIIDFEDLYTGINIKEALPSGYAGFTWSDNAHYYTSDRVDATYLQGSGYEYGMDGDVAIVNSMAIGLSTTIMYDKILDFYGALITSGWLVNHSVTIEGWKDDQLLYSETILTSFNAPVSFTCNYQDINKIVFLPGSGTSAGLYSDLPYIIIDNIDDDQGVMVPEPSSLILLGLGLSIVAIFRKSAYNSPFR